MTKYNCPQCIAEMPGSENLVSGDVVVSDCHHEPMPLPKILNEMFINHPSDRCNTIVKAFLKEGLTVIDDCAGITLQPLSGLKKVADKITLIIILEDAEGNGHSHSKEWQEPELLASERPITDLIADELRDAVARLRSLSTKESEHIAER